MTDIRTINLDEQPLVNVNDLACVFQLTSRRVQQLADEGYIPKSDRNEYPIWKSITGYIKYLQDRVSGRNLDGNNEKTRLLRLQADSLELKLAAEADLYVMAEDAELELESVITAARSELMSSARKLKKQLKKEYKVDVELKFLQRHVNDTLTRLAEH